MTGTQMPTNRLGHMTTIEAAATVERQPVVLLPAGAFEQHGAGLPLHTDTIRAEHVAGRVADALPETTLLGPSVPVGISPHHLAFAGTVSLRTDTFIAVLRDYLDSLRGHGWRRFLVVTGHGGNAAALGILAQDLLRDDPSVEFAWTPVTSLAADVVADLDVSEVHGHSGEAETAQMLHLAPQLVHTDRLTAGTTELDQLDPLARLARATDRPAMAFRYDRLASSGVLGDPRRASADAGRRIVERTVERIVQFVREWVRT